MSKGTEVRNYDRSWHQVETFQATEIERAETSASGQGMQVVYSNSSLG